MMEGSDAIPSSSSSSSSSSTETEDHRAHFIKREYYNFEPLFLDMSNLRQGQHMTVVQLPSLRVSFLPYASKEVERSKKNKMFQFSNPQISKKILFTNIVELKEDLVDKFLNQEEEPYLELYSVAHSWVLFERLIYKNVVKTHNQRHYLAACLKISMKLYELFGDPEASYYKEKLSRFNDDVAKFLASGQDDAATSTEQNNQVMNKYEKLVMIALHFEPRVPPMLVQPHIDSIQVMTDKTLEEYLGHENYTQYTERISAKI